MDTDVIIIKSSLNFLGKLTSLPTNGFTILINFNNTGNDYIIFGAVYLDPIINIENKSMSSDYLSSWLLYVAIIYFYHFIPRSEFLFTLQGSIFIPLFGIISTIQCYKIYIKELSSREKKSRAIQEKI